VQVEKLAHCDKLFQEKESGTAAARPQLGRCLEYVREGDILLVTRLDRLARSMVHLCAIGAELARKGVELQVLDQAIDTSTPTGRLTFHLLGAFAQFENELRAERQSEGIRKAQARGVHCGRTPQLSPQQIFELQQRRKDGMLIKDLMRHYRLSKASVYRYLGQGAAR
jgi:DNA invertase Pin-like site-specific DNA recombinase